MVKQIDHFVGLAPKELILFQYSEAYLKPCQTFNMKPFTKITRGFQSLIIVLKSFVLGISQGSEYVSGIH